MGLLDHLWDDTVAGPRPENGIGKLQRHHTFSFRPSSSNDQPHGGSVRSYGEDSLEETVKVTRSIMIIKPSGYQGGSTPPVSPFSVMYEFTNELGTSGMVNGANAGGKEPFRFRRRSTSDAFDKGAGSESGPRNSPLTYGL